MKRWQDVDSIYQVYPRSFKDTDADGIGDLRGIIHNLDYFKGAPDSLGVDAIWISPFFTSPMVDFGYDISDYYSVDKQFGDLGTFKDLLASAHERGMRVMIDYVPGHTSNEHGWFKQSRLSKDSDKRDWYIWKDPKPDGSAPNNWIASFGGSAWGYDEKTGQYYLHSFLKEQPDLNWANPEVRAAMLDVLRFWLNLGVDGFRADAVRWLSKDLEFRDNPLNPDYVEGQMDPYKKELQKYNQYGPHLFDYLKEISEVIESYEDRIILFEDYPVNSLISMDVRYYSYFSVDPAVSAPFNFEGIEAPYSAAHFRKFISKFQSSLDKDSRPFYCFGNHDNSRLASRYGSAQAKLLGLMQLTLPGTPVIYYGDELGMEDSVIDKSEIKDEFEKNVPGLSLGRDPARSPMQWSDKTNAGFSEAKPWLPVSESSKNSNVESELEDKDSFLNMYKELLNIRHNMPVMRYGTYEEWSGSDDKLFGYFLKNEKNTMLVILNMSDQEISYTKDIRGEILCSTHPIPEKVFKGQGKLMPHQGILIHCDNPTK